MLSPVFWRKAWHTCIFVSVARCVPAMAHAKPASTHRALTSPTDAGRPRPWHRPGRAARDGQLLNRRSWPPHAWAILDAFLAISTECCPPCPTLTLRDLRNAKTAEP